MPMLGKLLPGFIWDTLARRYRYLDSGRFVSRTKVVGSLEEALQAREKVLMALTQSLAAGELAPTVWLVTVRGLLKWQYLQSMALGAGGFANLTYSDFGRIGGLLRFEYARLTALLDDLKLGTATTAQAVARMRAFVGNARREYYRREREELAATPQQYKERRLLDAEAKNCNDCVTYADEGWQPAGALPVPGEACRCGGNCRCTLEREEVESST